MDDLRDCGIFLFQHFLLSEIFLLSLARVNCDQMHETALTAIKSNSVHTHTFTHTLLSVSVGYAKNKAIFQSCGQYLCFQDAVSVCVCVFAPVSF